MCPKKIRDGGVVEVGVGLMITINHIWVIKFCLFLSLLT